jgi:6-phosphogluconate dehydrogenase
MRIGMVGLGRMGGAMARRLARGGHSVVAYDLETGRARSLVAEGIEAAEDLDAMVRALPAPRVAWVMLPQGAPTEETLARLAEAFSPGDILIDGGNGRHQDDVRRSAEFARMGLRYLDVGTSGGVWGLETGYCLMVGGDRAVFEQCEPLFRTLAPSADAVPASAGFGPGGAGTADAGYLYCGGPGAGHFVKMVHNGIEYGIMQAYAEGFAVLDGAASPLLPEGRRYELPVDRIAELWRRGSVIRSWLLDLSAEALARDPELSGFNGVVADSGEGRWCVEAAMDEAVPAEVLTAALYARYRSRTGNTFGEKLLSALRQGFGGHGEAPRS